MDQVKAPYYIEDRVEDVENYDRRRPLGAAAEFARQTREIACGVVVAHREYNKTGFLHIGNAAGDNSALWTTNRSRCGRPDLLMTAEDVQIGGRTLTRKLSELNNSAGPESADL